MKNLLISAGIIGLLSATSIAYADDSTSRDFVVKASVANEFEIESSKLALEKSQDKNVKAFAQRMIDDHTKTGESLKDALNSSKTHVQAQSQLDNKHQKLMDQLESLSGDDFNHQYIADQTDAHKEAVSLFSDYAKNGEDPTLKSFATDTLPALNDHLKHAQELKTTN